MNLSTWQLVSKGMKIPDEIEEEIEMIMELMNISVIASALLFRLLCQRRAVNPMPDCNWCKDEICVNADCPMCCDYCPVPDTENVCRHEDRNERDDGG